MAAPPSWRHTVTAMAHAVQRELIDQHLGGGSGAVIGAHGGSSGAAAVDELRSIFRLRPLRSITGGYSQTQRFCLLAISCLSRF